MLIQQKIGHFFTKVHESLGKVLEVAHSQLKKKSQIDSNNVTIFLKPISNNRKFVSKI